MTLRKKVEQVTHAWARKGCKKYRARQRRMMYVFAAYAECSGARNAGQVGIVTVINFWKHLRVKKRLSWATQMDYWRAVRELWALWGKTGEPPRPRDPAEQLAGRAALPKAEKIRSGLTDACETRTSGSQLLERSDEPVRYSQ